MWYFQFRGIHLPAEIVGKLANKELSRSELLVLVLVESMVEWKGKGCWATNKSFGQILDLNKRFAGHIITGLIRKGLLVSYTLDNVRYLETTWSRLGRGGVGRAYTPPVGRAYRHLNKAKDIRKQSPGFGKTGEHHEGNVNMGFFPEPEGKDDIHVQFSKQLRPVLKANGATSIAMTKNMAEQFRILVKSVNPVDVQNVLDWYCSNYMRITKPKVKSAKNFRSCFSWLKEIMEKDVESTVKEISPIVCRMVDDLMMLHWPKGSSAQLEVTTQITYNNFVKLRNKIKNVTKSFPDEPRTPYYLAHRLVTSAGDPYTLTMTWMRRVHGSIVNWKDWNGKLITRAFSGDLHDKYLSNMIQEICGRHTRLSLWPELREELEK